MQEAQAVRWIGEDGPRAKDLLKVFKTLIETLKKSLKWS